MELIVLWVLWALTDLGAIGVAEAGPCGELGDTFGDSAGELEFGTAVFNTKLCSMIQKLPPTRGFWGLEGAKNVK